MLQRAGRPQDIAEMVLYLAARAVFIASQIFVVDGGGPFLDNLRRA